MGLPDPSQILSQLGEPGDTRPQRVSPTKLGCKKKTPCPSHSPVVDRGVNNQKGCEDSSEGGLSQEAFPGSTRRSREGALSKDSHVGVWEAPRKLQTPEAPQTQALQTAQLHKA